MKRLLIVVIVAIALVGGAVALEVVAMPAPQHMQSGQGSIG